MRSLALIAILAIAPVLAHADSIRERLNAANALLRQGDIEGALNGYRDLRVDAPESPELQYDIGCAEYQQALKDVGNSDMGADKDPFEEARASFDKALAMGSGRVRENAAFNGANCLAQYAKHMPTDADQKTLVDAYQQSISAYEDVLRQYPENKGARKNLDHMRYLMKKMLQNPPQNQEDQGKGENKPQNIQQPNEPPPEQGKEAKQGEQNKNRPQPAPNERTPEETGQQKPNSEESDQRPKQKPDRPPMGSERDDNNTTEDHASPTEKAKAPDRQTIEALLESLEDRDQLEQRYERRQPPTTRIKKEWW